MPEPSEARTSTGDVLQAGEDLLESSRALLREVDEALHGGQDAAGAR